MKFQILVRIFHKLSLASIYLCLSLHSLFCSCSTQQGTCNIFSREKTLIVLYSLSLECLLSVSEKRGRARHIKIHGKVSYSSCLAKKNTLNVTLKDYTWLWQQQTGEIVALRLDIERVNKHSSRWLVEKRSDTKQSMWERKRIVTNKYVLASFWVIHVAHVGRFLVNDEFGVKRRFDSILSCVVSFGWDFYVFRYIYFYQRETK